MAKRRVLIQWIGSRDLQALAGSLSGANRTTLLEGIKRQVPPKELQGPTRCLIENEQFDEIRLLSNYDSEWNQWYEKWLGTPITMRSVDLENPTDYAAIFDIADAEIRNLKESTGGGWSEVELCLHLTPGSPAMSSVWLLLGKTRYPATFYQSFEGKSWVTMVPFDLVEDVVPDLLQKPDSHLQHLAADAPADVEGFEHIIGDSPLIRAAVGRAKRAAIRGVSVLLLGESGTGKELFAQAIHQSSPRRKKPFKAINCSALSATLLESELFGHKKGSFTGADYDRAGAFEAADGGTVFLDELGECALETQAKLLRVLQPVTGKGPAIRKVCRLGEEKEREVDVRIVAATNRDLHEAMNAGKFREDLYYRIAAVTISLPALRHRKLDIGQIAERLLRDLNQQFEKEEPGYLHKVLGEDTKQFVKRHGWPGNVRQLYNALVQASVFCDDAEIKIGDMNAALGEMPESTNLDKAIMDTPLGENFKLTEQLDMLKILYVQRAMQETTGQSAAAALLGVTQQSVSNTIKKAKEEGRWND